MMIGGTVVIGVISTFFLVPADADGAAAASNAMPEKKADVDRPAARMRPAPAA
jgi:hypothetical protein